MGSSNLVIAQTVYHIIQQSFNDRDPNDHPCFRIKNLMNEEILAFLAHWKQASKGTEIENIQVVISSDAGNEFPKEYLAEPGRSITYYRNNNNRGLVYLEIKVESDEQGLKNIFTLRDSNFLDGSFDNDYFSIPKTIVQLAWSITDGNNNEPPILLTSRIIDVLKLIHPVHIPVSVRKYINFSLSVIKEFHDTKTNLNSEQIDSLIGRNLYELIMFPDEEWRSNGETKSKIIRRLKRNSLHADLASTDSTDFDQDSLVQLCELTVFKNTDNDEYPDSEQTHWRNLCAQYCQSPSRALLREIPYRIFEQLFTKDVKGLQLGERVENEISSNYDTRLDEFNNLNLKEGLNERVMEDAQRLLEHESVNEEEIPLRDLLTKQTRRMVDKVAYPSPETFVNPLIKIAEVANIFRQRNELKDDNYRLEMRVGRNIDQESPSIGLFAFIYGATLKSVAENSRLEVEGMELMVEKPLLTIMEPPSLIEDLDNEDNDFEIPNEVQWPPIPLEFALIRFDDNNEEILDTEHGFQWLPDGQERIILLWLMLAAEDAPSFGDVLSVPDEINVDQWIHNLASRITSLESSVSGKIDSDVSTDPIFKDLFDLKERFSLDVKQAGITVEHLGGLFDHWQELLIRAKIEFIPDGIVDQRLQEFLNMDVISLHNGNELMLGSHPYRLRWLSRYLSKSEELAVKGIAGDLPLNGQNENLYFDWITNLSPYQQPPVMCNKQRDFIFSTGESGWTEEFAPINKSNVSSTSLTIDQSSKNEIIKQIVTYLNSHPYKKDGLSILLVLTSSSAFPSDLINLIRKGEWKDTSINLHVLSPRDMWDDITKYIEELPTDNRINLGMLLFPPLQLQLYDLTKNIILEDVLGNNDFDIAVVPQFLNNDIEIQQNTEPEIEPEGSFDPLLDRPTYVHGGTKGGSISVSMRPRNPDPSLDAWSTLSVRHHRLRPISSQQPENTDFVELTINFDDTARLFEYVHKCSHWVITLERYITREQIEMLDPKPDILSVKENIGTNGLYTLIVSSNTGGKFIINRLERKLSKIVHKNSGTENTKITRDLAIKVYSETRMIAPRLALQAMGISRVTEEILGLMIARHVADQRYRLKLGDGIVVWLSFDDHPEWFRGESATRADLCRITFERLNDELYVDILVLEGKLRQAYDPHGVDQVKATLSLIKEIMPTSNDQPDLIDSDLWREHFLKAMESVSPDARTSYGVCCDELEGDRYHLPHDMRKKFRNGDFIIRNLSGLFSICRYDQEGQLSISTTDDKDIEIAKSFKNQIIEIVSEELTINEDILLKPEDEPFVETQSSTEVKSLLETESSAKSKENVTKITEEAEQSAVVQHGKLSDAELSRRYQIILDTYGEFGISVQMPDDKNDHYVEGPASVLYRIKPGLSVDPRRIYEKASSLKLALFLSESQNIRFSINKGFVTIDVPKNEEDRYFVNVSDLWKRWNKQDGSLSVPLGVNHFGDIIDLNFSSANTPHLLIGGTTGSGKSEALNTILYGLVKHYTDKELRLLLVDPKGTELQEFSESPYLEGQIGWDESDALTLLNRAVEEMQWRYERFREIGKRSLPDYNASVNSDQIIPWWVIVLDEYADLTSEKEAKNTIEAHLKRLAQKARAAGIHVIIATQKPSAEVISTNLRSNLPAQLALRVKSSTESRVVMDEAGAETLNGKGDAFLKAEGKLTRIQCAIVDVALE